MVSEVNIYLMARVSENIYLIEAPACSHVCPREVSRPQAVRSSGAGGGVVLARGRFGKPAGSSHDLGTFTAADIREKWLKEQKVICIMQSVIYIYIYICI